MRPKRLEPRFHRAIIMERAAPKVRLFP